MRPTKTKATSKAKAEAQPDHSPNIRSFTHVCEKLTHDIRTPLSILHGLVEDLSAGYQLGQADVSDAQVAIKGIRSQLDALSSCSKLFSRDLSIRKFQEEIQEAYSLHWKDLGPIEYSIEEGSTTEPVRYSNGLVIGLFGQVLELFFRRSLVTFKAPADSARIEQKVSGLSLLVGGLVLSDNEAGLEGDVCGKLAGREHLEESVIFHLAAIVTREFAGSMLYSLENNSLHWFFPSK